MNFASKDMTSGELNAVVKMLGGEAGARAFMRGEIQVMPDAMSLQETEHIVPIGVTFLPARTEPTDMQEMFAGTYWLEPESGKSNPYHSLIKPEENFCSRVRPYLAEVPSSPARAYVMAAQQGSPTDQKLITELPESFLSYPEDVACFIKRQLRREPGALRMDGFWNTFYLGIKAEKAKPPSVFAIDIGRKVRSNDTDEGGWHVGCWKVGEDKVGDQDRVLINRRVFYPYYPRR